jgi:hypothetical protein
MGMGKGLAAAAALVLAIGCGGTAQAAAECVLNGQGGDCRGPILVTDQITVSGSAPVVSSSYSASGSTTSSSSSYSSATGWTSTGPVTTSWSTTTPPTAPVAQPYSLPPRQPATIMPIWNGTPQPMPAGSVSCADAMRMHGPAVQCHGHYVTGAPAPMPAPPVAHVPPPAPMPMQMASTQLPASFFVGGLTQGVGYGIGQGYVGGGGGGVVIVSGGGGGTLARSPIAFRTPDFSNRFRRPAPPPQTCCKHH